MDIYQILRVQNTTEQSELQSKFVRMIDTYQMAVDFAENQEVADIARMKLEQLIVAGKECGLYTEQSESTSPISTQANISSIKLALNSSGANASIINSNNISGKIDALPPSAEKHYLKTIALLKTNISFQGCNNALSEIQKAIKIDPSNEAYLGLLDAISEQLHDYEYRQKEIFEREERARRERERQSQRIVAAAQRRQFFDSAEPIWGGLIGIGAVICCCWCIGECFRSSC